MAMMALKYTERPYGLEPERAAWDKFPRHAKPIDTAPISATPIIVYEPDGPAEGHRVIHHLGRWMQVESTYDSYSGKHRLACNGQIVNNPVLWSPSS
jgi:hypothetical protein